MGYSTYAPSEGSVVDARAWRTPVPILRHGQALECRGEHEGYSARDDDCARYEADIAHCPLWEEAEVEGQERQLVEAYDKLVEDLE